MNVLSLFEQSEYIEEFSDGETIFREDTPGDVMYVVLEGEVEIQVRGRSIYTAVAGEVVGEMALIDSKARSASAVALGQCRLAPVDQQEFLSTVQQVPSFALHIMRVLADRIRCMDEKAKGR